MVQTITPEVFGGRTRRFWLAAGLHVAGATIAAGVLGALLGGAGALLGAPWGTPGVLAVVAVAALYGIRETFGLPVPLPQLRRQVPEWWRTFFSPEVAALLYGAGLGVGFVTFLTFGTFAAVAAGAVAGGSPLLGMALCGCFGVARSAVIVLYTSTAGGASAALPRVEIAQARGWPRVANALALGGVLAAGLLHLA